MTTAVYIDGLNLYYGLAKPLDCKWVDIQTYFEKFFSSEDVQRIYFCEALVSGPNRANQLEYFRALSTLPKVEILQGKMKKKERTCYVRGCSGYGVSRFDDNEEKHTDVAIAITMVRDALEGTYEKQVLVSADTDLLPAVKMVRQRRPGIRVHLFIPSLDMKRILGAESVGREVFRSHRPNAELFVNCQFPSRLSDDSGVFINRPATWREAPKTAVATWKQRNQARWLNNLPRWMTEPSVS